MIKRFLNLGSKLGLRLTALRKERFRRKMLGLPRYKIHTIPFLGKNLEIVDGMSFWSSYEEIFLKKRYEFHTEQNKTVIIDAGANIGLATICLNKMYPEGTIYAFEPDPKIFETLKKNVSTFCNDNVKLIQKGLWDANTILKFFPDGADGGTFSDSRHQKPLEINVTTLKEYLKTPVSFLKIDIEGAEFKVLEHCKDDLVRVENIFVEYHSYSEHPQVLHKLVEMLIDSGFRINIISDVIIDAPMINSKNQYMDMQLNIFGYRP